MTLMTKFLGAAATVALSAGAAMAFMIAGAVSSIPAMAAVWSLVAGPGPRRRSKPPLRPANKLRTRGDGWCATGIGGGG